MINLAKAAVVEEQEENEDGIKGEGNVELTNMEKISCMSSLNFKCGLQSVLHVKGGGNPGVIAILTTKMSLILRVT